jgi:hypothetical protein
MNIKILYFAIPVAYVQGVLWENKISMYVFVLYITIIGTLYYSQRSITPTTETKKIRKMIRTKL